MFSLKFFGGFKAQHTPFMQASEFAPVPVHAQTNELFERLTDSVRSFRTAEFPKNLWSACLKNTSAPTVTLIICSLGAAFAMLFMVIIAKELLQARLSFGASLLLCFAFLLLGISKNALRYLSDVNRLEIMRMLQVYLMALVNRKVMIVDPKNNLSTGNLKTLISSDVEAVEDFVSGALGTFIPCAVMLLVLCPYVWSSLGLVGLCGLFVMLLQLPVSLGFAWLVEKFQTQVQAQQDSLITLIGEWVKNIRLVRYLGWQPKLSREIAGQVRHYSVVSALKHTVLVVTYGSITLWWFVTAIAILSVSKYLALPISSPDFFSSIWILGHLSAQLSHAQWPFLMLGAAIAGKRRLEELFAKPDLVSHIKRQETKLSPSDSPVKIHIRNASVLFNGKSAIDNLSLSIDLKSRTAIVGDVGAGKTLLLELIVGELFPTIGAVTVEFESGLIADLWEEETYYRTRSYVAFSPQRPYLSNASLRDNIDLSGALSDELVERCAELAHLQEDLKLFPRGLAEEVGETGINLSGGQKQRVSMARAFASGRPIFVLDDPLSAVDRATEKILMQSIIKKSKALILVSHRLDELSACERVVVMRGGKIVEDGKPQALLNDRASEFVKFIEAHKSDEPEN